MHWGVCVAFAEKEMLLLLLGCISDICMYMWRLYAHVYACVCICILRWEVAPIHVGGCSILLGNLRSTCAPNRDPHWGQ